MWIDVEPKKRRVKEQKIVEDNAINYCSRDVESLRLRTPLRRVWSALAARCRHSKSSPFPSSASSSFHFVLVLFRRAFHCFSLSRVDSQNRLSVSLYPSHVIIFRRSARIYFRRLQHPFRTSRARYIAFSDPLMLITQSLIPYPSFAR